MTELGVYNQGKFLIYTDNNSALALARNPVFHERTKHIAVKYHYIRQLIEEGTIDLVYINTKDQKSDGLTKLLNKTKFKEFLIQIGLFIRL
jgi:methyl coenzyme M reductase subunit D